MCKKSPFFTGVSPWFLSKMKLFTMCAFLANQRRKKHFFKIFWIERPKNLIFQSGYSRVFVKKLSFALYGFFRQTKAEKMFFNIPGRKEQILDQKSILSKKKLEKWPFLDKHHGFNNPFGKMSIFRLFDEVLVFRA